MSGVVLGSAKSGNRGLLKIMLNTMQKSGFIARTIRCSVSNIWAKIGTGTRPRTRLGSQESKIIDDEY